MKTLIVSTETAIGSTGSRKSPGRPRVMEEITELVLRMARENGSRDYTRIQGALRNLGHKVGRTTVANILKEHGIEPAPERGKKMTSPEFLRAHWSVLAAADFFTIEVWGLRGLVTIYVFFVIELATRRIEIAGITTGPSEAWMMQVGRNLTDPFDGFLADKRHLILDRDSKFSNSTAVVTRCGRERGPTYYFVPGRDLLSWAPESGPPPEPRLVDLAARGGIQ